MKRFNVSGIVSAAYTVGGYQTSTINFSLPVGYLNVPSALLYINSVGISGYVNETATFTKWQYSVDSLITFGAVSQDYSNINFAGVTGLPIVSTGQFRVPPDSKLQGCFPVLNLPSDSLTVQLQFQLCNSKAFVASDFVAYVYNFNFSIK